MSDLLGPLIAGFAIGIAFVVLFSMLQISTNSTTVGDPIVGVNATQHHMFTNAMYLPKTSGAGDIHIASYAENLYITWYVPVPANDVETERGLIASSDAFFARSSDVGTTFSSKISLTDRAMVSDPLIAAHENNVYLLWTAAGRFENIADVYDDIFFRASHDDGATFGPVINLSDNIGNSWRPQIAVSGNNVYVIWEDYSPEKIRILLRISNDRGNTFGSLITLSSDNDKSKAPQIAVSNSNIYVVWHDSEPDDQIILRSSTNNGTTFSKPINLRSANTGTSCCPKIAASENDVYVVWADNELGGLYSGHYNLHFRASHNRGLTFDHIINLSEIARDYKITASGRNVYVTWTNVLPINRTMENAEAFFIRSTDNGMRFENPINLSDNEGSSGNQQIAVSDDNVYVAWVDHTLGYDEILFRGSNDNGASFGRVINLSNSTGISVDPSIAVFGNNVYLVWKEFGDEFHNDGIYFVKNID
jgi:hypothetical protein